MTFENDGTQPGNDKDADLVTKPKIVGKKIDELVQLTVRAKNASERLKDAIKAVAEESGYKASALRKFVAARAGEDFAKKMRECEQQMELFEEVGE